jgi:DinB superfamily
VEARLARRWRRLGEDRQELLRRVADLGEEDFNRSPGPGGWSVAQVITHLTLAEEGSLSYVRKKTLDPSRLPAAGLASRLRRVALTLALRSPLRFRAPARVNPDSAPVALGPARERWDAVRTGWGEFLEALPAPLLDRAILRHPLVGLLGAEDALAFLHEHLAHHARQIESIGRRVAGGVPPARGRL